MSYTCYNCGKHNSNSTRSQHHKGVAGGAWKHKAQKSAKLFRANLRKYKLTINGDRQRVKLCTDCISKLRKDKMLHIKGLHIVVTPVPQRVPAQAAA